MLYVALSSAVLIYLCLILLLAPIAKRLERTKDRVAHIEDMYNTGEKYRDEDLKKPLTQRFLKPVALKILGRLSDIFPKLNNKKLKNMLEKAGYKIQPVTYNAIMFLVIIAVSLGFMLVAFAINGNAVTIVLFAVLGLIFGMLIMRYTLQVSIRRRKELMRRQMPEVLDLLSVSVEAGLGFDAALMHVVGRLKGPLTDELLITYREINLGRARKDALTGLAERTALEEMVSFTSAIIQAEQQGISLKNVLNVQAAQIRQSRRQSIEEKAMKAPVKIIIPLVMFIFPVILIVLLAPAIMNIINVLGGL